MVIPTKLRPPQADHIHPSRSSTTHRNVDPTRSYILDIPPNPVKRPEHPIFLESSYESVPSSTRVEPTESLTFAVRTTSRKQHSNEMIKTQKPQATDYGAVDKTAKEESSIIVTRVDSSITKVTNTLVPVPDDKMHAEAGDSVAKATTSDAKDDTNSAIRMKPKEVRNLNIF